MAGSAWADAPHRLDFDPAGHVYRVDGAVVPSVTQCLDDAGLTPDYSLIQPQVLAHARHRGIHVDLCCDLLDEDDLDWASVDREALGYVEAWARFREDQDYLPRASQVALYHPEHGYAGTLDSVGELAGRWIVVERKATARMAATYALQTAGYALPGLWAAAPDGILHPVPWPALARLGVHLKRDGAYTLVPYDDLDDLGAFLGAVTLARWRAVRRGASCTTRGGGLRVRA
jgi:hypothetical protein